MMHCRVIAFLLPVVLLACAGGRREAERIAQPALQMDVDSVGSHSVWIDLKLVNAQKAWLWAVTGDLADKTAEQIRTNGKAFDAGLHLEYGVLQPSTDYILYACAEGENGRLGAVVKTTFQTWKGGLYAWEESRTKVPFFADMALLYGAAGRTPKYWSRDRLKSFVTWTDPDTGEEKWLFDAFLILEGRTSDYPPRSYAVGARDWSNPSIAMPAANQADALTFLDYWFNSENGLPALDALTGEAIARIGEPVAKTKIIVMMPDIAPRERYNVVGSSTTYWGKLQGVQTDFSQPAQRRAAYFWYVDEVRKRFAEAGFQHIELGGFYIMSEELPSTRSGVGGRGGDTVNGVLLDGWEGGYKAWDEVFPMVSDYIHRYRESVCWIPYRAAAGYRYWTEFGIDYAWMQPNYYWDTFGVNPMSSFFSEIARYNLAMELEFDDMMMPHPRDRQASEYTKEKDGKTVTETWEDYANRWRSYIEGMKSAGVYGVKPIAMYQDTDSFNHLRQSSDPVDNEAFHELCRLIANDPLKANNR